MVTMQDIADKLGINKSTVSKALNNSGDINPETADNIRKLAYEMGFVSRKKHISNDLTVGVIYPEMDDAVYTDIVKNLSGKIEGEGCRCVAIPYNFDSERITNVFSYLIEKKVDGIFLFGDTTDDNERVIKMNAALSGTAIVRISMNTKRVEYDNIWVNEEVGVSEAVRDLVRHGHRKIAFIGDAYSDIRLSFFGNAVRECGIDADEELIVKTKSRNFESGYDGAITLLESGKKFTAVFCQYDAIAAGAMRAFSEKGIRVPHDCSVVGFDDANYSGFLTPSLSTVNSNVFHLCSVAFRLMQNKLKTASKETQSVLINSTYIARESVADAAADEPEDGK